MTGYPSMAQFAAHLGSRFELVRENEDPLHLELIELSEPQRSPRQEQFAVLFRGPVEPLLPQRIYRMGHPAIGTFALFLVPISSDDTGICYEAIFSRLVESNA